MAQDYKWNDDDGYDNAADVDRNLWAWIKPPEGRIIADWLDSRGIRSLLQPGGQEVSAKVARTSDIF